MASRRTIAHRLTTPSHKSPVPTPEPSWFRGRKLALLSFVFPKPGAVLWGDGGPTLDGVPIPEDIREEENRFKFALLSTTLLLFIAYDLLLLLFLCPLLESNSSSTGFMPATSPPRSPAQVSAAFFRSCIEAFLLLNSALLVFLYLVRHIAAAACCVFLYINGGVWTVCIVCGPVSEFLACLVHVPMLAFYVFGHNAGVRALAVTLGQITVYSVALFLGFVPTSGYTLELGPTAQMLAVMGSFVLLGLSACVNERARMQALCKYQQANKRLSKTTRAKARFLANVSHELRTPLHGIVAAGEELVAQLAEDDVPPLHRDMTSIVVECSRHMLSLINDVLDFERMETKQMKVERIPFDIADELQKLAKMLAPMAKQKNILVKQEIFVETQRRMGDPLRFRQMVFNLASNALKFTPEGGTVTIRVAHAHQEQEDIGNKKERRRKEDKPKQQHQPEQKQNQYQKQKQNEEVGAVDIKQKVESCGTEHGCCNPEDMVRVEVQDTGIGIPDDHLPLIFKSFTQADASTTRKFGGSGLGLAICKRLCRLMEGEIGVESKRGEGSTFWFHLPLPPATERESMMSPVVTKQMTESGQGKSRNGETLKGVKALLVEDNIVNQKIGVQMLVRAGCSVSVAENGEQCLRVMEEKGPFDVVLMDCHMPIMGGLETTRRIRQREQERHEHRTPVIALTASTSQEDMHQCTLAGMDDWLSKPFDRAILTHVIRRWVHPSAPPNADQTSPAMSAARSV